LWKHFVASSCAAVVELFCGALLRVVRKKFGRRSVLMCSFWHLGRWWKALRLG
jgi:hypothetical protein